MVCHLLKMQSVFPLMSSLRTRIHYPAITYCSFLRGCRYINNVNEDFHKTLKRTVHTSPLLSVVKKHEYSFMQRAARKLGWLDYSKSRLKATGYYLLENILDKISYEEFFQEFQMADTFYSWFLVTELHVWMLMVRLMAEGDEGRFVRNSLVEALWNDVDMRSKQMMELAASERKRVAQELCDQFNGALFSYDEGIQSSDIVLAGALWRRFFLRNCDEPLLVEKMVEYVRKQVKELDAMSRDQLLIKPQITWIKWEQ